MDMEETDSETQVNLVPKPLDSENLNDSLIENAMLENECPAKDPYYYTKRDGDFTSEIFKIEISNIPNYLSHKQLKTLFHQKLDLKPHKIKAIGKFPIINFIFVTFRCEEDRENALKVINGYELKGKKLIAKRANPAADPLVRKRKEGSSEDARTKRIKSDCDLDKAKEEEEDNVPVAERMLKAVVPWKDTVYSLQIEQKQKETRKVLVKIANHIEKTNPKAMNWLQSQRKAYNHMCCQMLEIIPSPVMEEYRNKCEFNIGRHLETGEIKVGFRLSSYRKGSKSVVEPLGCINVPKEMILVAKYFQNYICDSDKDIYDPETREGYWRQLTVRTNLKKDIMIIITMHPQKLTCEEIDSEKSKLKKYFEDSDGHEFKVLSVFFQVFARQEANAEPICDLLYGKVCIEEELLGLKFCISPSAFFQVNSLATELLYKAVDDFAAVTSKTTVLDICCGTGTIGITLAKKAKKVFGIEICEAAVSDAKKNAELNGIKNIEFLCSKAEDAIHQVLHTIDKDEDIVAIVDPPRAGLNNKVTKAIRGMPRIKRLVYLSCDPSLASNNFTELIRPESNAYKGNYFLPVKAVPVDLFPHTPHCELVILFERL